MNVLDFPDFINKEKDKLGFAVYEYIDFSELQKTILIDYTNVIVKFNIMFLVISLMSALFAGLVGFLLVLSIIYFIIFLYLFIKLIFKVNFFISLNKVIVTNKGLIIGNTILDYNDPDFSKYLEIFEKEFYEFLFKESRINIILKNIKYKMYNKLGKNFNYLKKGIDLSKNDIDGLKIVFIAGIFMSLYGLSTIVFYYIGYLFVYIFGFIIIGIIKLYLHFFGNIEFKIHANTLYIHKRLGKLDALNSIITKRLNNFKEGEITNLGKFIEDNFNKFYSIISDIFNKKNELYQMMEKSKYKDYINFDKLKYFIKTKFNEPIDGMIEILKKYMFLIEKEIEKLNKLLEEQKKEEYIGNLKIKKVSLKNQIQIMELNLKKLEKMKI